MAKFIIHICQAHIRSAYDFRQAEEEKKQSQKPLECEQLDVN